MATTSKTKSWKSLVKEADPNLKEDIVVYKFKGKKRKFTEKHNKGYN